MDLRDKLAVQRTVLANQRTLLAFFNAALALFIAGVTLIKFFPAAWLHWAGWAFLPLSAGFLIHGFRNYAAHGKTIETAAAEGPA